ncbi:MAG TPA: AsnC family transcriptional regulator [Burkholderiales bacterium]|jgi:DNA-binding Lrp family transcriptional regulator|nr:AsnC family transcriptional regulator [Burkholderiales bacterium]
MREPHDNAMPVLDELDRAIVNRLQRGLALTERPYAEVAQSLSIPESTLLERLGKLLERNVLSRFGPLFDAERLGGAFTLCAMSVPAEDFERVAALVNAHPEVAHNYERDHAFNLWFVLAVAEPEAIDDLVLRLEAETGYPVINLPRLDEYYIGLQLAA